jgi:glyoxylase-like metal-dependent hydrolase (beta-lactamase superfamily II)
VSRRQWNNYSSPNALEKESFRQTDMLPVFEAGLLRWVDDPHYCLTDDVQLSVYEGHTEGQLVTSFPAGEVTGVFAGDVIPSRAHLAELWISAYDIRPLDSLTEKLRLKKALAERPSLLFFYHDAYCPSIGYIDNS